MRILKNGRGCFTGFERDIKIYKKGSGCYTGLGRDKKILKKGVDALQDLNVT